MTVILELVQPKKVNPSNEFGDTNDGKKLERSLLAILILDNIYLQRERERVSCI